MGYALSVRKLAGFATTACIGANLAMAGAAGGWRGGGAPPPPPGPPPPN